LGRSGEAGEVLGVENHRLPQLTLQAVPVGAEAVVDVLQLLEPLAVVGTVNGLKHFGGIAVESLTRRAGAGGLARDGAVHTLEDSGSVGDAKRWR